MPTGVKPTIDVSTLPEPTTKFSGNELDAMPSLAYAITAYHKSNGRADNKYWQSYANAIQHVASVYGRDTANQLQEVATSVSGGDNLSAGLRTFARNAMTSKKPYNTIVKNILNQAVEENSPLEKWQYGFDMPKTPREDLADRISSLFKKS